MPTYEALYQEYLQQQQQQARRMQRVDTAPQAAANTTCSLDERPPALTIAAPATAAPLAAPATEPPAPEQCMVVPFWDLAAQPARPCDCRCASRKAEQLWEEVHAADLAAVGAAMRRKVEAMSEAIQVRGCHTAACRHACMQTCFDWLLSQHPMLCCLSDLPVCVPRMGCSTGDVHQLEDRRHISTSNCAAGESDSCHAVACEFHSQGVN